MPTSSWLPAARPCELCWLPCLPGAANLSQSKSQESSVQAALPVLPILFCTSPTAILPQCPLLPLPQPDTGYSPPALPHAPSTFAPMRSSRSRHWPPTHTRWHYTGISFIVSPAVFSSTLVDGFPRSSSYIRL